MSRIGNRRKAVDLAWKREKELVLEGKGTRDWTEEQQRQIIEDGRATDESGRAFDGHHMKNVATYPEYQEDPNNIQFLSRSEHLDAHGGCTHNSTNGFYDYKTGETIDFGDNPPIPCEIIELSNPIYLVPNSDKLDANNDTNTKDVNCKISEDNTTWTKNVSKKTANQPVNMHKEARFWDDVADLGRSAMKIGKSASKTALKFATKHPIITGIGLTVGSYFLGEAVGGGKSSKGTSGGTSSSRVNIHTNDCEYDSEDDYDTVEVNENDDFDYSERLSPSENDVRGHYQHYHTKDGVIEKYKEPYHRGGNKEE